MELNNKKIDIFQKIKSNYTIVTPNRRLSATLHKLYQKHQIDQNINYWITPDILPLATWLQRLWNDYTSESFTDTPMVLNPTQENFLWENVINSTHDTVQLLQISETAELVKSAWGILKQWQVDIDQPLFKENDDSKALDTWATTFQTIIQKNNWIDFATLTEKIIEKIKLKEIIPNKKLILVGFSELSPQLKALINVYQLVSDCVVHSNIFSSDSSVKMSRISLLDTDSEILTMARWAKKIFNENKSARIGCVIPSLDKIRDRVFQLFKEVFDIECFNISAGKPLIQCSIVYTAFQLLGLHKRSVSLDIFSSLLASPFLAYGESERLRRAHLDSVLRKENINTVHLPFTVLEKHCPRLAKKINHFLLKLDQLSHEQSYREWAKHFCELLSLLGWPGERSLNSEEYQIVDHWLQLLEEFSTLDQVAKPTTFYQALGILKKNGCKKYFST